MTKGQGPRSRGKRVTWLQPESWLLAQSMLPGCLPPELDQAPGLQQLPPLMRITEKTRTDLRLPRKTTATMVASLGFNPSYHLIFSQFC